MVAEVQLPLNGQVGTTAGEWTLPDGTVQEGFELRYTPTVADREKGQVNFTFTGWVVGFKDQGAIASNSLRVAIWEYEWPTFRMITTLRSNNIPTSPTFSIVQEEFVRNPEQNWTYEWNMPEDLPISGERSETFKYARAEKVGTFDVEVIISDDRGNSQTITEQLTFEEAEPYTVGLSPIGNNRYMRAPINVRMMPAISGGHREDRVSEYKWSFNGIETERKGRNETFEDLAPGVYTVDLEVTSLYGAVSSGSETFEVFANQPPTCNIIEVEYATSWLFTADCDDEDGFVRHYSWTADGVDVSTSGRRLLVYKRHFAEAPYLTVLATDDAGAVSELTTSGGQSADYNGDSSDGSGQ